MDKIKEIAVKYAQRLVHGVSGTMEINTSIIQSACEEAVSEAFRNHECNPRPQVVHSSLENQAGQGQTNL